KAIASTYAQLIGNYSPALADSFLTSNFTDTSDSINALADIILGSVTFPSKEAFETSQANSLKIPLFVTSINAVTCDTLVLRWTQTFGPSNQPVAGISILILIWDEAKWKLKTLYTEFNSLTYFQNTGGN
ncbi:uncharacterized protein BCR38DRAFT_305352, partial [Pseudomassariella vexata]